MSAATFSLDGVARPQASPCGEVARIPLTRGYFALVDTRDFEWLIQWQWIAHIYPHTSRLGRQQVYAQRVCRLDGRARTISMHREIIGAPAGHPVDHRDGDGLNNQRANLRLATYAQNAANRVSEIGVSGFRGVYREGGKWVARIAHEGKRLYLGIYNEPVEAARIYDHHALRLKGEFAILNFPAEIAP